MKPLSALIAATALSLTICTANAAIIDNTGSFTGSVSPFGSPNTATYGQTLLDLAGPDTHLASFSMFLRGRSSGSGTLDLRGYVAEWDGTKALNILYESATQTMNAAGILQEFHFLPDIDLTPGGDYVFFLSISNLAVQPGSTFSMPINGNTLNGQFVFLNNSTNFGELTTTAWTTNHLGLDDVWLKAELTAAVPEPATLALFGLGLAGLGFTRRRMRG